MFSEQKPYVAPAFCHLPYAALLSFRDKRKSKINYRKSNFLRRHSATGLIAKTSTTIVGWFRSFSYKQNLFPTPSLALHWREILNPLLKRKKPTMADPDQAFGGSHIGSTKFFKHPRIVGYHTKVVTFCKPRKWLFFRKSPQFKCALYH